MRSLQYHNTDNVSAETLHVPQSWEACTVKVDHHCISAILLQLHCLQSLPNFCAALVFSRSPSLASRSLACHGNPASEQGPAGLHVSPLPDAMLS